MPNLFDQYLATSQGIFSLSEISTLPEGLPLLHIKDEPVQIKSLGNEELQGVIIHTGIGSSIVVSPQTLIETQTGWVAANKLRDTHRIQLRNLDTYPAADLLDLRLYNPDWGDMKNPIYYDEGMAFGQGLAYGLASSRGSTDSAVFVGQDHMTLQGFPEGTTPDNCFIPWELYRSPKNIVISFLKGTYKSSGSADSEAVTLKLKSYIFASEIQFFLSLLGIFSFVSYDGTDVVVSIDTLQSAQAFQKLIGFQDPQRDGFLEVFLSNYPEDRTSTAVLNIEHSLLNSYKIPEVRPFYLGPICIHPR
jgi:hypothetical protein